MPPAVLLALAALGAQLAGCAATADDTRGVVTNENQPPPRAPLPPERPEPASERLFAAGLLGPCPATAPPPAPPRACPLPETAPSESAQDRGVYDELRARLAAAPRVLHFGSRFGDTCAVPCDGVRVLCGPAAREALRAAWRERERTPVPPVALRMRTSVVGALDHYWFVHNDGSATFYHHRRTDVAPARCGPRCGWHRDEVQDFLRPDGTLGDGALAQ